jgi:hypothetical protein
LESRSDSIPGRITGKLKSLAHWGKMRSQWKGDYDLRLAKPAATFVFGIPQG